eukprot:sb/3473253/
MIRGWNGTKKQIDYGIELVLKIVSKKNDGSALEVISYETDILENYIQDEESLVCLGEFTESYPKVLIKVEPHKKRIVVKGDVSDDVKKITEYLRESLSDYAAEYVGKSKARSPPTRNVDGVVTKPFSLVSGEIQISEIIISCWEVWDLAILADQ